MSPADIDAEMIRLAEADAAAKGNEIDDIRPCDRVVDLVTPDDVAALEAFFDEFVVDDPEWSATVPYENPSDHDRR